MSATTPEHIANDYTGSYCGCCGRMCGSDEWCDDCRPHLLQGHLPLWERTYFARYGRECPHAPAADAPDSAWDARRVPVGIHDHKGRL